MVSDFVDEGQGYLALTEEEYERASQNDSATPKQARQLLAYGENREGYWTCEKFMQLDQSSCHTAMAEDAVDVTKMNVGPGGK